MKFSHNIAPLIKEKVLIVEDQFIEAYDLQLILENAGYIVCGTARSVEEALPLLDKEKPAMVLLDIFLKGNLTGIDLGHQLQEKNIPFIYISANSGKNILEDAKTTQPYGFVIKPFREQDVITTLEIAFYRQKHSAESQYNLIHNLQEMIRQIPAAQNWENSLVNLSKILQPYIHFDYFQAGFAENPVEGMVGLMHRQLDEFQIVSSEKLCKIADLDMNELKSLHSISPSESKPLIYTGESLLQLSRNSEIKRVLIQNFRIKSYLTFPIEVNGKLFNFCFFSREPETYDSTHLNLLGKMEQAFCKFVEIHCNLKNLTQGQAVQNNISEITLPQGFEGMIGTSPKILVVYEYIKKVAPLDISVLILGENGTGKEKVAQAIHNLSSRNKNPFVAVNCGAIPENLAESLLFGHEKGAFTGASDKRIGKFEQADGGTIFLDEIGDMPLDLQIKLLRVLQEREIDRVGSSTPVKIDVRIIAATNKNLSQEVAAGRFRIDLYYRLHVFPINVPSLRERKTDIPILVAYFAKNYCLKIAKEMTQFSKEAIFQMLNYDWPGNIRELEHLVQRSLLLSDETVIRNVTITDDQIDNKQKAPDNEFSIKTITENEKEYILYVLKKCNWKISGIGGAAELLDIPPSTLNSKIKKLEIRKI